MFSITTRSSARFAPRAITLSRTYANGPKSNNTGTETERDAMDSVGEGMKKAGKALQSDGKIGKNFNADGSVGGKAQEVGGPFSADGAIGKQFTDTGAIGGLGQKVAEAAEDKGKDIKK